ncbi:hypothetical protein [Clostridium saccharoperbutylacetonicum]|uniref:hypothetical protein n=1 Tax=Clostridium saccharoperbutylacetonicum TaxID=36745 RepID=UPI0039E7C7E2
MGKKKKDDSDYVPSDRVDLYAKITLIEELERLGKKWKLSRNQMALRILYDNIQKYEG